MLAGAAALLLGAVDLLWRPGHLLWARNAYGMAQAGAWTGGDAFLAFMTYWFLEMHGRTVVTIALLGGWLWGAWRVAK